MSAFVVTSKHIATCAKIIREKALYDEGPDNLAIRRELAEQNIESVAYRYGPEGRAEYAKLFGPLIAQLTESLPEGAEVEIPSPEGLSADGEKVQDLAKVVGFESSAELQQWFRDVTTAEPIEFSPEEGFQYLRCLSYQSCEHPAWQKSKAHHWIESASTGLAYCMSGKLLNGRHVWAIDD